MKRIQLALILTLMTALLGCGKPPKSASGGAAMLSGSIPLSKTASDFGYSRGTFDVCTYETAVLYRSDLNICVFAQDGCEVHYLRERGFIAAPIGHCEQATRPDSDAYVWIEFDYPQPMGQACSLQFKIMKNSALRICLQAENGCAISYTQNLGFTEDRDGVCESAQQ